MLLHKLGHIQTDEGVRAVEQVGGQLLYQLGLAHAGGTHKDEGHGLVLGADAHPAPADGGGHRLHGLVLADDVALQPLLQLGQALILCLLDAAGGNVGPKLDDVGQVLLGEFGLGLLLQTLPLPLQLQLGALDLGQAAIGVLRSGGGHDLLLLGQVGQFLVDGRHPGQGLVVQVHVGAGLVDKVDGLVGQIAVGDIPLAHHHRPAAHLRGDGHLVIGLVIGGDALDDLHAVLDGGLLHHHRLEAPLQGGVLFDVLAVFVQSSGTDDLDLPPGQGGL